MRRTGASSRGCRATRRVMRHNPNPQIAIVAKIAGSSERRQSA